MLGNYERVGKRLLALGKLPVILLKRLPGLLLFKNLLFGSPAVANDQEDNDRDDGKDQRTKQRHMIPQHIGKTVGKKPVIIAVQEILGVFHAENADTAVQQSQQSLVSDLHSKAPRIDVAGLPVGQRVVFPVSQNIVGAQPVHRRAAHFPGNHSGKTFIHGVAESDLRIRIVGPHKIILHAVVLIDGKVLRRLFAEFALVDQLGGRCGHCIGLVDTVLFGIVKSAADRECDVNFTGVDRGDHIVIAFAAYVGDVDVRSTDGIQNGGNDVFYRSVHIALTVRIAIRQVVFKVPDM